MYCLHYVSKNVAFNGREDVSESLHPVFS